MTIYSSPKELEAIAHYLTAYMKIPYFQDDSIPGQVMEKIVSLVHSAKQLATYDYVDVVIKGKVGWSVKSTKAGSPLTWKRAKIANKAALISASEKNMKGLQDLGDAIIDFCNSHAAKSIKRYSLNEIGFSRLIVFKDGTAIYFERSLCTERTPVIFDKNDYVWEWSVQKNTTGKEQLPALHGKNNKTGKKAFAWHGKGENQLHFSGEEDWWPEFKQMPTRVGEIYYSSDGHAMAFKLPNGKVSWDELTAFLNTAS